MHKQKYIVWYQENGPLYPVDRDITEYMASTDNDASRIVILPALTFFLLFYLILRTLGTTTCTLKVYCSPMYV